MQAGSSNLARIEQTSTNFLKSCKMSQGQAKVSEYFSKRKKCDGLQPSKRRKVLVTEETETSAIAPLKSPPIGARTRARISKVSHPTPSNLNTQVQNKTNNTRVSKSKAKSKVPVKPANQKTIADVLSSVAANLNDPKLPSKEKEILTEAIPTAACDNHNVSPPSSPIKRRQKPENDQETIQISNKRSRCKKVIRKDLFQEEINPGFNFEKDVVDEERKVVSPKRRSTDDVEKTLVFQFQGKEKDKIQEARIQKLAEKVFSSVGKPAKYSEAEPSESTKELIPKPTESKSGPSMEKLKTTVTLKKDPAALKNKLSHCTNLADLKDKLRQLKQASSPKKKEVQIESPTKSRLVDIVKDSKLSATSPNSKPAYERFSTLEEPVPAGLTLPRHYKMLHDMFTSADTIVSMLHKRAEICTFSKLKSAVQDMTRKNFDLKNLGQIKTVYPSAYQLQQEKNLPCYGKKNSNEYQLTVEANLINDPLSRNCNITTLTKDGRPDFTGSKIMERKTTFHRKLIDILRKHHKEFLSSMDRPIMIPDNKVTRWHPKFPLESVPDIEVSELPRAQTTHVITTAKEALEHAKEKFNNPRVLQALEKVAAKHEANDGKNKTPKKSQLPGDSPKTNTNTPIKADNQALKGVSQSFLDKIRAKEARKQEESMLRTPAEEKKKERLGRLPELVRIIRTLFVTSKKPALLKEDVIEKVTDSYKSCMGQAEAECHLKLMIELVPEWVSIVTLKRGVFVTINRNKDINVVIESLNKQRKLIA